MMNEVEHDYTMSDARYAMRRHFGSDRDKVVSAGLVVYFVGGNRGEQGVPAKMVVRRARVRRRGARRILEEGKAPELVLEMASVVTNSKERGRTRKAYARMGVREYFRYEA